MARKLDCAPLVLAAALLVPAPTIAAPLTAPPKMQVVAVRVNPDAPVIDGRLDDPAWRHARFVSDFLQKDPQEGEPATEKTEAAVLYDDDALYIGARMYCARPNEHIRATVSRRDNAGNSERFIVSLDTYHDHRTCYSFAITATGVRADYYHPIDNEYDRDYSYDPVWVGKAHVDSLGWTAEIALPFSQLRFRREDRPVWGINLNRWVPADYEDDFLVPVPKSVSAWSSWFPELVGLEGITPHHRVEMSPYVAGDGTFRPTPDSADPFTDGRSFAGRAGGDVKVGIGPNLTLDATINPDFGQVEADPAEVNLTAFETFFGERRPFFTEGSQLLAGQGPGYFYSRRIGARPHVPVPGVFTADRNGGGRDTLRADYSSVPTSTTILGAAKLTGRLNSGLSIGALSAVTSREWADLFDATAHRTGRSVAEPAAGYGVVRVQQEFGPNTSTAGLSLTAMGRDIGAGDPAAGLLDRRAFSGGADWNLRFRGGAYALSGYAGFSHIRGDSAAILGQQMSSRRYYQRPDTDYLHLDPGRTSLSGYAAGAELSKISGNHWLWELSTSAVSPGFELNDAGQLSSANEMGTRAELGWRVNEATGLFRSCGVSTAVDDGWNFGGERQYLQGSLEFNGTFQDHSTANFGVNGGLKSQSDDLSRGGPTMEFPGTGSINASYATNWASNLHASAGGSWAWNDMGGWGFSTDATVGLRTGGRWELSVAPHFSREHPVRQYITTLNRAAGDSRTFGRRYIFSALDKSVLSAQIRLNYAFTPDLTLELYAEPFAAAGNFHDFGEMALAGSRKLLYYGTAGTTITRQVADGGAKSYTVTDGADSFTINQADYNVLSFRSNLVLRWAWRPGSTFFLVWQQNRADSDPFGRVATVGRLFDSFSARGENFLAVKATYWIPAS